MNVLETDRLVLRRLNAEDAPFILELLNDPGWLQKAINFTPFAPFDPEALKRLT